MSTYGLDDWLTRKQVSDEINYSTKTLANWASMNPPKGPKFRKPEGGHCRYLYADVVEWKEKPFSES